MGNALGTLGRSPRPPKLGEASRPVPSLPNEILQPIIQLLLPPLSFNTFRERYNTLSQLCRINKQWRAVAQAELCRHVWLTSDKQGSSLLSYKTSTSLNSAVTKSVWLQETTDAPVSQSTLRALIMTYIVDLTLDYCHVPRPPSHPSLTFNHLRRLVLSSLRTQSWPTSSILSALEVPHLHTLILLFHNNILPRNEPQTLEKAIIRLASKLKMFGFAAPSGNWLGEAVWSSFATLEHLLIYTNDLSPLYIIPSTLRQLTVRPRPSTGESEVPYSLFEALQAEPRSLMALKELSILPNTSSNPSQLQLGVAAAPKVFLEWCQNRGIQIDVKPITTSWDYSQHLSEVVEVWW